MFYYVQVNTVIEKASLTMQLAISVHMQVCVKQTCLNLVCKHVTQALNEGS